VAAAIESDADKGVAGARVADSVVQPLSMDVVRALRAKLRARRAAKARWCGPMCDDGARIALWVGVFWGLFACGAYHNFTINVSGDVIRSIVGCSPTRSPAYPCAALLVDT
jgi:hypothetical protein